MYKILFEITTQSLDLFDPTCEEPQDFIKEQIELKQVIKINIETNSNCVNSLRSSRLKILWRHILCMYIFLIFILYRIICTS